MSRDKGIVACVEDGGNRWSAGHVDDVAKLYVMALDRGECGARYNAVAEEGVVVRDVAGIVAERLGLPLASIGKEEAAGHFGWFASMDLRASSALTGEKLNWAPKGPGLLDDLRAMDYSAI